MTAHMVKRRLAGGRWQQLAPNVLAIAGTPTSERRRLMAAVLGSPQGALCATTAALLHGLDPVGGRRPRRPEVAVPVGANRRNPLASTRQRRYFQSTTVDGIPVGTIHQTLLDLAGDLPARRFEPVAEQALVERRTHLSRLEDLSLIHAGSGLRGLSTLRRFVESHRAGAAIPESELERRAIPVLDQLGVPYVLQFPAPWDPTGRTRVDVFIPSWNLIVELDGYRWHASSERLRHDVDRSNLATIHGHRLLRLTWFHLERPTMALDLLRSCAPGAGLSRWPGG